MQTPNIPPKTARDIPACVARALDEDVGAGDITAMLLPITQQAQAQIITRQAAVICGQAWVEEVFKQLSANITIHWRVKEGEQVVPDQLLASLSGNARALLTGERTALNFLQTLSGTATCAKRFADKVQGRDLRILDTRKTIPGLRLAQKYAVTVGGCKNHRMGLHDAFLIKENHIQACGGIAAAITQARHLRADTPVQIEVETLDELLQALTAGADAVMLDNFSSDALQAVNELPIGTTRLEISGNLTEDDIHRLKDCGVHYLSSGSLTKHVEAIDLSMRILDLSLKERPLSNE